MIASISGIRGVVNEDLSLADAGRFARNFAVSNGSSVFLLARDTRATGPAMSRAVASGLMSAGAQVRDYGVISTPALFRQSRTEGLPAMMVTASHNEPEFNGLKFVVDGSGVGKETFDLVMESQAKGVGWLPGKLRPAGRLAYVEDLVSRFHAGSCEGVKVALDLGGGAAISHAPAIFRRLGCKVVTLNDAYGVFNRKVDPVADDLALLRKAVATGGCDVGYGFDCDGDRLVVVDSRGRKRTGDYMLTLALREMLNETGGRKVVVSLDTTQAVDDVAKKLGASVRRAKVGEANVVGRMKEEGARLGGEGSSGGLIDGDFNYCRDSLLAGIVIARALRTQGRKFYDSVPSYHIRRGVVSVSRKKVQKAIRRLVRMYPDAEDIDGIKVWLSKRSWVLVRPSGTEDIVRVSAEAETSSGAERAVKSFSRKVTELSK